MAPRTARASAWPGRRRTGEPALAADGRRLDRSAQRIVRRAARRAGIGKTVTPHTLRHAFITAVLMPGAAVDVQKRVARDPRTTMRYDRAAAA
jgi:integrase